ncbi:hypothetical protein DDF65_17495 [Caulobacter radicis]|uniref:Uncharacterized protein n=1 Tax=Caulobacter radicis TaxID=2172650 RepID=A0A2T9J643_9CAUL|nr:hypothetical protein DDF65_17495 [Caulobacter radicis]
MASVHMHSVLYVLLCGFLGLGKYGSKTPLPPIFPAKAGIQAEVGEACGRAQFCEPAWAPAFAGEVGCG